MGDAGIAEERWSSVTRLPELARVLRLHSVGNGGTNLIDINHVQLTKYVRMKIVRL